MRANILDRRRFAMVAVLGLMAAVLPFTPAQAQTAPVAAASPVTADKLFVADAIPVDVTAGGVTDARERALTQGRVAAFRKIIERVVAREDMDRVPQSSAAQIIDMVRDFSIANERSSAVRYIASLTVRFDPVAVRRLLRGANIPFTEIVSKPLVVVPVMRDSADGKWVLWEGANIWREAWANLPQDIGLVPLIVPTLDKESFAGVSGEQAAGKDLVALNALATRYGAGGTILAMATGVGESMQIAIEELRSDLPSETLALTESPEAGQSRGDVFGAGARASAVAVQDSWKRRNRVSFGGTTQITALVPVTDLKEWLLVKKRLDEVPLISRLELQAITRDRTQVTLHYAGAQRQLELAMSQHDLALEQQNGVWIITARGTASSARVLGRPGSAQTPAAAAPPAAASETPPARP